MGEGGEGRGGGQGGEMTQTMYAHVNKWVIKKKRKKIWYLYTMEFYSAMKKNEILLFSSKMDGTGEHHSEWGRGRNDPNNVCTCE
jgi:hypothetical protein